MLLSIIIVFIVLLGILCSLVSIFGIRIFGYKNNLLYNIEYALRFIGFYVISIFLTNIVYTKYLSNISIDSICFFSKEQITLQEISISTEQLKRNTDTYIFENNKIYLIKITTKNISYDNQKRTAITEILGKDLNHSDFIQVKVYSTISDKQQLMIYINNNSITNVFDIEIIDYKIS